MELESAARRSTEGGCAHTHTHTHTKHTRPCHSQSSKLKGLSALPVSLMAFHKSELRKTPAFFGEFWKTL